MAPTSTGAFAFTTSPIPFRPEEIAYFVPQVPEGASANGVNDVYVDENRLIYAVDRIAGGLYILEPDF